MADSGDTRGPEQGELFAQHTIADASTAPIQIGR